MFAGLVPWDVHKWSRIWRRHHVSRRSLSNLKSSRQGVRFWLIDINNLAGPPSCPGLNYLCLVSNNIICAFMWSTTHFESIWISHNYPVRNFSQTFRCFLPHVFTLQQNCQKNGANPQDCDRKWNPHVVYKDKFETTVSLISSNYVRISVSLKFMRKSQRKIQSLMSHTENIFCMRFFVWDFVRYN